MIKRIVGFSGGIDSQATTIDPQLAYILEHPDDDTARMIYADHLEEQGEAARAEFIRVQVKIAADGIEQHQCYQCYCQRRELQHTNGPCRCSPEWKRLNQISLPSDLRMPPFIVSFGDWQPGRGSCFVFWRGFIDLVYCTTREWLEHADYIVSKHPVTTVSIAPDRAGEMALLTYEERNGSVEITVRSSHGLKATLVGDGGDSITTTAKKLIEERWPQIKFRWPAN